MKVWKGEPPRKQMSIKLDGVQAMLNEKGEVVSRSGKPLFNVNPKLLKPGKRYEIYRGSLKATLSAVRSHKHRPVTKQEVFEIWPGTDKRIVVTLMDVAAAFKIVTDLGFEGLVIDQTYKLKKTDSHDVQITKIIPGKGKHTGRMGALMTTKGKVGTGFTDKDRQRKWKAGELIEVECMELTAEGKFRHPRFVRLRWDKEVAA